MTVIADAFRSGYKKGWDKCRDELCKEFDIDKEKAFAWECSDKDLDILSEESQSITTH